MSDETAQLIKHLITLIGAGHECSCKPCCDCTTNRTFEQTAARFNEQAAFNSAESQKDFLQQQSAQFAQLLKLQHDTTNKAT